MTEKQEASSLVQLYLSISLCTIHYAKRRGIKLVNSEYASIIILQISLIVVCSKIKMADLLLLDNQNNIKFGT